MPRGEIGYGDLAPYGDARTRLVAEEGLRAGHRLYGTAFPLLCRMRQPVAAPRRECGLHPALGNEVSGVSSAANAAG
jgi:hypothetical protein